MYVILRGQGQLEGAGKVVTGKRKFGRSPRSRHIFARIFCSLSIGHVPWSQTFFFASSIREAPNTSREALSGGNREKRWPRDFTRPFF